MRSRGSNKFDKFNTSARIVNSSPMLFNDVIPRYSNFMPDFSNQFLISLYVVAINQARGPHWKKRPGPITEIIKNFIITVKYPSNFSFKWTKPVYQNNFKYITVLFAFSKS